MRILIAENNELTGVLMRSLLEQEGHQVSLVLDGLHAFSLLEAEHFDLVVSEVLLPYYTGLEVLHMINQLENRPHVIILSAVQNLNTVYRAYQMGVDLYMTKPFDPDQLPREIEKIKVA
jgi:DNA-binding response OmpR family regulator